MIEPVSISGAAIGSFLSDKVRDVAAARTADVLSWCLLLFTGSVLFGSAGTGRISGPVDSVKRVLALAAVGDEWVDTASSWVLRSEIAWVFPIVCAAAALYSIRYVKVGPALAWVLLIPSSLVLGGWAFAIYFGTVAVVATIFIGRSLLEGIVLDTSDRRTFLPDGVIASALTAMLFFVTEPIRPVLALATGISEHFTYEKRRY
ncbi:hypothetical protein ACO0E1_16655 [Curtobacterium sp. RRHDQ66]|uniref:hypothetical protein n=1 Tax=Curtobacterium guangdongense TaxID=3413380 RepID=UPI003BF06574